MESEMFFEYEKPVLPLTEYLKIEEARLSILPHLWREMMGNYTADEIKGAISSAIKGLPFPFREYSEMEVSEDWEKLRAEPISCSKEEWVAPRQQKELPLLFRGEPLVLTCGNNGLKVSNQYTQEMRMECGYHSGNSPMFEWQNPDKGSSFLRCLFGILDDEVSARGVTQTTLYRALKMHTYMASQFKPSCAKAIYDFFGAKKVLDFSMGWGDRLVGFLASGAESYVGIDPNTKLHKPYSEIVSWVGDESKRVRAICAPAEDADLSGVEVDFVFTSPPYFDIERYSDEGTQSWKRYPTTAGWLEGFLFPTLTKCWGALSDGGRIAVNMADKRGEDTCSPMFKHMESLGATYEGVVGYKMHKRNGIGLEGTFCEPVFVWSKGVAPEPRWKPETFFGV